MVVGETHHFRNPLQTHSLRSVLRKADRASIMIDVHGYGALLEGCAAAGDPGPPGKTQRMVTLVSQDRWMDGWID